MNQEKIAQTLIVRDPSTQLISTSPDHEYSGNKSPNMSPPSGTPHLPIGSNQRERSTEELHNKPEPNKEERWDLNQLEKEKDGEQSQDSRTREEN